MPQWLILRNFPAVFVELFLQIFNLLSYLIYYLNLNQRATHLLDPGFGYYINQKQRHVTLSGSLKFTKAYLF